MVVDSPLFFPGRGEGVLAAVFANARTASSELDGGRLRTDICFSGGVHSAVEAFARALRQIPTILADNAGYDSSDLVTRLRAAHYEGKSDSGLGTLAHLVICSGAGLTACARHEQRDDSVHA